MDKIKEQLNALIKRNEMWNVLDEGCIDKETIELLRYLRDNCVILDKCKLKQEIKVEVKYPKTPLESKIRITATLPKFTTELYLPSEANIEEYNYYIQSMKDDLILYMTNTFSRDEE